MWQTIGLVTSAFTLVAFLATCLSSSLNRWNRRRYERDENLIAMAREQDRADLIRQFGEQLNLNFDRIPEEDRLPAVHAELDNRRRRITEREGTIRRIAFLFAALAVVAIIATAVASLVASASTSRTLWGEFETEAIDRHRIGREILNRRLEESSSPETKDAIEDFRPEFDHYADQVESAAKRQSAPALRESLKELIRVINDSVLPEDLKSELQRKSCGNIELIEEQHRKLRDSTG